MGDEGSGGERPEGRTPSRPERSRARHVLSRIALDLSPLRTSRDFRLLWSGELISETGYQIALVAVYVQVYELTGSPAAVGLIGLVSLVPQLIGAVLVSAIVDAVDRRKLLVYSQVGMSIAAGLLLLGAVMDRPPLALIYGAVGFGAVFSAIDSPTRIAMVPRLVGREELPAALALNQVMWNGTTIVGPAIGGIVIAQFGLDWAYGIDLISYGATLGVAALMRPVPPEHEDGRQPAVGLAAVREGLTYLKGRRVIQSTFTFDLIAMIFGMPRALFPVIAVTQFGGGAEIVGLLLAAPAAGALAGSLTAGWVGSVRRQGLAVIWAVVAWGACIALFGLVGQLWLALVFLALAGWADMISALFRNTILQLSVPDSLRGRMSSIHVLVVSGGPRLGDLEAGLVAQAFTAQVSIVSGGLLCIAGAAIIAIFVPGFRRYRTGGPDGLAERTDAVG
ncbi:MAG: MFS transporter [Actinomycetota bacterium]